MSDAKEWIEERQAIHASATQEPWALSDSGWSGKSGKPDSITAGEDETVIYYQGEQGGSSWEREDDAKAIVDAHNMFPRALNALNAVLELHRKERDEYGCWTCRFCSHIQQTEILYPCATVRATEGAIND